MSIYLSFRPCTAALLAVLLLLPTGCRQGPERLEGQNLLVLQGATLIDGTGAAPRGSSAVVIDGPRILRVGAVGDFRYPDDAIVVDLAGRWLLPGFMDLHAHMDDLGGPLPVEVLGTLVRFGITTFRSPAAAPGAGRELRDRIAAGEILGPRMFTAGRLMDVPGGRNRPFAVEVATTEEIRAEVRQQAESGVDFVKFYNRLGPEMIRAGIDEAHAAGVRTIGHLGETSWADAAGYGIDAIVHSGAAAPTWELVPPEQRAPFLKFYMPGPDFDPSLFGGWQNAADLDGLHTAALVSVLAKNGVEVNPTLVMMETIYWGDEPALLEELEPDYAPSSLAATWRKGPHFTGAWPDEARAAAKKTFSLTLEMVRRLHEGGVLLTAGSDLGNPWITPGVSLHREMWLLNRAGIPALEVLKIATRNGAEALGILDQVGTIESGKRADLVVLTADPVDDIRNTRAIEAVYLEGKRIAPEVAR